MPVVLAVGAAVCICVGDAEADPETDAVATGVWVRMPERVATADRLAVGVGAACVPLTEDVELGDGVAEADALGLADTDAVGELEAVAVPLRVDVGVGAKPNAGGSGHGPFTAGLHGGKATPRNTVLVGATAR